MPGQGMMSFILKRETQTGEKEEMLYDKCSETLAQVSREVVGVPFLVGWGPEQPALVTDISLTAGGLY